MHKVARLEPLPELQPPEARCLGADLKYGWHPVHGFDPQIKVEAGLQMAEAYFQERLRHTGYKSLWIQLAESWVHRFSDTPKSQHQDGPLVLCELTIVIPAFTQESMRSCSKLVLTVRSKSWPLIIYISVCPYFLPGPYLRLTQEIPWCPFDPHRLIIHFPMKKCFTDRAVKLDNYVNDPWTNPGHMNKILRIGCHDTHHLMHPMKDPLIMLIIRYLYVYIMEYVLHKSLCWRAMIMDRPPDDYCRTHNGPWVNKMESI